jgi:hypothetical protein
MAQPIPGCSITCLFPFDPAMLDTIAIDLSDALVKCALTVHNFPSLATYAKDVAENKHAFLTLKAHVNTLSDDVRAKVNQNLVAAKGMGYFPDGDTDDDASSS